LPTVTLVELKISGISKSAAEKNLGSLSDITSKCIRDVLGSEASKVAGDLSLRFTVKWNGRSSGTRVSGDAIPSAVRTCVRSKIPRARYPQPRPGKDGVVRATLRIGS
jgi:hypothetical protein